MTRNIEAKEKLEDFINKLASLGYEVREVSKKPQIYSINGEIVNIVAGLGLSRERMVGGSGIAFTSVCFKK